MTGTTYDVHSLREAIQGAGRRRSAAFPLGAGWAADDLAKLRGAAHAQTLLAEIRAEAERAIATPVPTRAFGAFVRFFQDGDRDAFQALYFDRNRRLAALALAALVDGNEAAIRSLENLLWDICGEFSWALPAHLRPGGSSVGPGGEPNGAPDPLVIDLFAAETAHALAEAIHLLEPKLHPWVKERVRGEIERRVFEPLLARKFFWETVEMNWASVCAGGVGMAALLLDETDERLPAMLKRVLDAMDCFLGGYGEDGGCPEGVMYWEYGVGYYSYFAEMLRDYTDGAIDLLPALGEKGRRIAGFPIRVAIAKDRFVNYSDSQERTPLSTGLVSRLAARLGMREAAEMDGASSFHHDRCYRWAHIVRGLFWTDPTLFGRPAPAETVCLEQLQWVVDRSFPGGSPLVFSAKGGHNAEPHNHNDLGHFLLVVGGETLLPDLGKGVYTRDYFGERRYEFLHPSSLGHSVPVVNGRTQAAGPEYRARITSYAPAGDGLDFALDLTRAYPVEAGLAAYERRFSWRRLSGAEGSAGGGPVAVLELTDAFRFASGGAADGERLVHEAFVSYVRPALAAGDIRWRGEGGAEVRLAYDAERFAAAAVEELPCDGLPEGRRHVYRVALTASVKAEGDAFRLRFACYADGGTPQTSRS